MHRAGEALLLVGLVVACSSAGQSASPSPPGITTVRSMGGISCTFSTISNTTVGTNVVVVEHFKCDYVMSDSRLSGDFAGDFTTTFEPGEATAARWEGSNLTITNSGGSWQGTGRGALVQWAEDNGQPTNYGHDTYVGAGGYAGLTYTEFVSGSNSELDISGWITERL
jgi:hypothetical protein